MNIEKIFKNLIILNIVFFISLIFIVGYIDWHIPVDSDAEIGIIDGIFIIFAIIYFINLYFLYKFKPIGKTLYLPLVVLFLFYDIFVPYESFIMTPGYEYIEYMSTYIDGIVTGMMLTFLYFTDIKDKFIKK